MENFYLGIECGPTQSYLLFLYFIWLFLFIWSYSISLHFILFLLYSILLNFDLLNFVLFSCFIIFYLLSILSFWFWLYFLCYIYPTIKSLKLLFKISFHGFDNIKINQVLYTAWLSHFNLVSHCPPCQAATNTLIRFSTGQHTMLCYTGLLHR